MAARHSSPVPGLQEILTSGRSGVHINTGPEAITPGPVYLRLCLCNLDKSVSPDSGEAML